MLRFAEYLELEDFRPRTAASYYRAPLLLIYASGLRVRECIHLTVDDIDGPGNRLFVHDGKGGKARLQWLQLLLEARLQATPKPKPVPGREILCPRCGRPMRRIKKIPRVPPTHRNEHFFPAVVV